MSSQEWKTPDEIIRLQRLNKKKKQLQARLINNNNNNTPHLDSKEKQSLLEAVVSQKRKNPFGRSTSTITQEEDTKKRQKTIHVADISEDDSLFNLINAKSNSSVKETPPQAAPNPILISKKDSISFSQENVRRLFESKSKGFLEEEDEDEDAHNLIQKQTYTKHLPVDWSIKSRLRMFSEIPLPNTNLKSNQEASGITSFVRCLDLQNSNSGLDISPAAKLNQSTYYWQHPHFPWMTLFPRNAKSNPLLNITANNDAIKDALVKDWNKSFKGLFQLLRARQCPYFYMFANSFSVLFRAAGIGGKVEMNAMLTPTSRGLRNALKQEGIEFTMPLKGSNLNRSTEEKKESSFNGEEVDNAIEDFEDDEEEDEEWLESLGVDKKEIIKNIATTNARLERKKEMSEDFSDISLIMIEGSECQALFNFLLNAKSLITAVGRLAGIPPTLLAPVAFPKASMQMLETKSSKLRMDGVDYFSIELKGIILPHVLPFVMNLFANVLDPSKTFSSTLATSHCTLAFGKASQKINEDDVISKVNKEEPNDTEEQKTVTESDTIFFAENLSDSGIPKEVIRAFCRIGENSCHLLERVCFSKEHGYSWK
ncbi:DONSON family protein [Megaselia abdita]